MAASFELEDRGDQAHLPFSPSKISDYRTAGVHQVFQQKPKRDLLWEVNYFLPPPSALNAWQRQQEAEEKREN
ncbi:hypothetical protein NPIL_697491 [Nephila pilipes]|uniref:Uncharacterized protein n=1 Tax=Nephila pilipes TaxID=299642 RepID=A0A8X6MKF7_NEPPI|nr:hypothetical protein NPIL_697491 [Nephila pilipes]